MGRREWEWGWARPWMARGGLTPTDLGERHCVACTAITLDGGRSFIVRPRTWSDATDDSLDVVEELMGLEDRLGVTFPDETYVWDADDYRDICPACEERHRIVFGWHIVT